MGKKYVLFTDIHFGEHGNSDEFNQNCIDFIEFMACPNGCVGGGGQPKQEDNHLAVSKRGESLFKFDSKTKDSYQNLNLTQLYSEFLGEPNGEKAQEFLHMNHSAR